MTIPLTQECTAASPAAAGPYLAQHHHRAATAAGICCTQLPQDALKLAYISLAPAAAAEAAVAAEHSMIGSSHCASMHALSAGSTLSSSRIPAWLLQQLNATSMTAIRRDQRSSSHAIHSTKQGTHICCSAQTATVSHLHQHSTRMCPLSSTGDPSSTRASYTCSMNEASGLALPLCNPAAVLVAYM
jgi:hypothetical protein